MELTIPSIPLKYRNDIEIAANLLRNAGCQSIYLFGSLVTGKSNDDSDSDIDIGIKGLPKGKFFDVYSSLYFNLEHNIDLVNFDANADFYSMLDKIGEIIQIG